MTDASSSSAPRVFPCHQCGASLRFAPSVGQLACPTCGTVNALPTFDAGAERDAVTELDYGAYLRSQVSSEDALEPQIVTCPQCGAQTHFDANVVAAACAFCASPLVAVAAHSEHRLRPRGVVPFALEAKAAQASFKSWIAGRWFAPNALKRTVQSAQGVRGVYVPCWTFDANTETDYDGQRGVQRTIQEQQRDSNGNTVTVTRVVTDWYPVSGHVSRAFDDVLVEASASVPDHLRGALAGWDIKGMRPYHDDFVAGFTVEAYQVGLEPAFGQAQAQMAVVIESDIRADIGGSDQRILDSKSRYHDITFKHILLPVWIASYQFRGTSYRVVVNGQTGAISGDRPWSVWKIGFTVLAVGALALWLWVLSQQ